MGGGVGFGVPDCKSHVCTLQVSPTEIRGALGSVNQLAICVGILLALIAGLPLVNNPAWCGLKPYDQHLVCEYNIEACTLCKHALRMICVCNS
jgi:hypothetical protein